MAIIRYGGVAGTVSGSLGGHVYVNARSGPVIRKRPVTTGRDTSAAILARGMLGRIAAAWNALTAAQRLTWRTAAAGMRFPNRLGVLRSISGFGLYSKNAMDVYLGSPPASLVPPTQSLIYAPTLVGVNFLEGGPYIVTSSGLPLSTSTPVEYAYVQLRRRSTQLTGFNRLRRVASYTHVPGSKDIYALCSALGLVAFSGTPIAGAVSWQVGGGYLGQKVNAVGTVDDVPWTIDDYEGSSLAAYGYSATYYSLSTAVFHSGAQSLRCVFPAEAQGFQQCFSIAGLPVYPVRGCDFEGWLYWSTNLGSVRFQFGQQDANNYYDVRLGLFGAFSLRKVVAGVETVLASVAGTALTTAAWSRVRVQWGAAGTITVTVYNAAGTSLGTFNAADATYVAGGYGWQTGNQAGVAVTVYYDGVRITGRAP